MRRFLAYIVFVFVFVTAASADSFVPVPAPERVNLVGTINGKLKIRMKLAKQGNTLVGSYFYETRKKEIVLQGTVNEQGYFQLDEYRGKDSITGYIVGAFTKDHAVVGFWSSNESTTSPNLPLRLVEESKTTVSTDNKLEVVTAAVRNNAGRAQLLLINDTVIAFSYQNVGAKAHTCMLITDRSENNVQWASDGETTTLNFTKRYFNDGDNTAKVMISKTANGYALAFEGYLQYFCGARAMLPAKVTLRKSSNGWTGQSKF